MLFNKITDLVNTTIEKIPEITKPRAKFFKHIIILFLGMRGRYNFVNLSRYGKLNEKTYRNQFEKPFPWGELNTELIKSSCSHELISAFDPTFLPKSGKHTPHVGYHWSSVSGQVRRGIEFGCLGVVDVEKRTAMSLAAVQTPFPIKGENKNETMVDHYLSIVLDHKENMERLGISYHVVDGYFAKEKYVSGIVENTNMDIICRLRVDANLRYRFTGEQNTGRGRKRIYDGKVNLNQIDRRRIRYCFDIDDCCVFFGIVYSVGLKRLIRIVYIEQYDKKGYACAYTILFSTDLNLSPEKIYEYYTCRFQIEFLFRDAKQHVGMENCQGRSENKINFHVNASLTTVSLAKAGTVLTENQDKSSFSMADVKVVFSNKILTEFIFSKLALDLSCKKISRLYLECLDVGRLVA